MIIKGKGKKGHKDYGNMSFTVGTSFLTKQSQYKEYIEGFLGPYKVIYIYIYTQNLGGGGGLMKISNMQLHIENSVEK